MKNDPETIFQTWFKSNSDAVFLMDTQGIIVEANNKAKKQFGYRYQTHPQNSIFDFFFWLERQNDPPQARPDEFSFEEGTHKIRKKDDSPVEINISSVKFENRELFLCISRDVAYDIIKYQQAEQALQLRDKHSQSLLRLSRNLEQAQNYNHILNAALDEVHNIIGYNNLWVYLVDEDKKHCRSIIAGGPLSKAILTKDNIVTLNIEGDRMLEEIAFGKDIVVVPDARTDERTNKQIVEQLGNRTIVNVPIFLSDRHMGSIGTGSFGDEGVIIPTQTEQEFLRAMASHMAVSLDRMQLLEQRTSAIIKLQESEERYRLIAENTADTITVLDMDLNIIYVSPSVQKLRGFTVEEAKNQSLDQIFTPASLQIVKNAFEEEMILEKSGNADLFRTATLELEEYCKDGSTIWVEIAVSFLRDALKIPERLLTVTRDITKRKQYEKELQKTNGLLRAIIEAAPVAIIDLDLDGKVHSVWNPAAEKMLGWKAREIMGKFLPTVSEENNAEFQQFRDSIRNGKTINGIEVQRKKRDGSLINYNIYASPLFGSENQITGNIAVLVDMTERKRAEKELIRTNRALRMLSYSNQALIRNTDEAMLLNEVCQIIVNEGGYRMAWVGITDQDEINTLQPVASAGYNSGYIESLEISWTDNGPDLYPNVIALRTGKPSIVRNISQDTSFARWREAVLQRGYKSCIALPLISNDHPHGTLGIFSIEPDAFDEKEVEILNELAGDLAFGISALHLRIKKEQAEEALLASEERFSAAFRFSPLSIIIVRASDECIVDTNEYFINSYGYSYSEVIGHTTKDLKLYANPSERDKLFNLLKKQDKIESCEFETRNKNGEIRTVISAITSIKIKGEKHYLTSMLDITERKKSEERLGLLSSALEAADNAIVITDKKSTIIWANNAFSKLTGYSLEEALGSTPRRLVYSGIQNPDFYRLMWRTILEGNVWRGEIVNKRKDGLNFHEYLTITPVLDKKNNIQHFIAVKQDISEQKKAEEELLKAKEKAEESNRLKSAFLATMNHELRTPLNHIVGFSDLLRSGTIQENVSEFANNIYKSSQSLLEIIESIFELALAEQTEIKLHQQSLECLDLFLSNKSILTEILEVSGKKDQIKLVFYADQRLLLQKINTDRNKINQVLINLFKNAVKFTQKGNIEFGLKMEEPEMLVFYVKDTGIGIPEDKHKIIFEFFRQADDSYTRKFGGVGIGLAISKKIAEVMNGTLSLESEPGKGSIFYFKIPTEKITSNNFAFFESKEEIVIPDLTHKKILIVEDDLSSMTIIDNFLKGSGAVVIKAYDGKEAIEQMANDPDLIIMDMKMPTMDGYTATRIIKSQKPGIPVLALTAHVLVEDQKKAFKAGCDGIISKPVEKRILFNNLKVLLFKD